MVFLRILGPPVLSRDDEVVLTLKKSLALISYLATERGSIHERAHLSSLLWPTLPKPRADGRLRKTIHSLRKTLDLPGAPLFSANRTHVGLDPDFPLELDLSGLLDPPASCPFFHDPGECPSCESRMRTLLQGIRGPFLDGFSLPDCEDFENWKIGTGEMVLARVRNMISRLLRLYEKNEKTGEAIEVLDGALRLDPLDESCHGRKMLLLAEGGDGLAALSQFEFCRKVLKERLGIEPDPETRAIAEKIRSQSLETGTPDSRKRAPLFPGSHLPAEFRLAASLDVELADKDPDRDEDLLKEELAFLSRAVTKALEKGAVLGRKDSRSLLFWFGLSGPAEGAAIQAARTALALCHLAQEFGAERGIRISCVAGIHSGRILKDASQEGPDPSGAVSRFSRALSLAAMPGEILLSSPASRLIKNLFVLGEPLEVRILGQNTLAYPLVSECRREALDESPPLLVGREEEMAALERLWASSQGGVVVLEGEAGIGKSALVRAFAGSPGPRRALQRTIECFPQLTNSPFAPVVGIVRGAAGIPEEMDSGAAYSRLENYVLSISLPEEAASVALLGRLLSLPPHPDFPLPALPAASFLEETTNLLLSILRTRSGEGSLFFVIEDLHWSDASTGELLRRILSDPTFTRRVFFLLTTRTGEDPSWLSALPERHTLRLSPLGREESRALVRTLGACSPLSEDEVALILETADGVPLFLEELTRERIESATLPAASACTPFPSTLSEILASRLDRLGEARPLLQRASVWGRTVPLELLRALSPEPPALFEALLGRAKASGLAARTFDDLGENLAFRHALIASAAYESLPKTDRKALHRQIAEILPERFPERAHASPEIVARHFESAGEILPALQWYETSVETALANGFLPEAAKLAQKALDLLPLSPDSPERRSREIRLLVTLGSLLVDLEGHRSPAAEKAIRRACDLAEREESIGEETFYAFYNMLAPDFGKTDIRALRKKVDSLLAIAEASARTDFRLAALYSDGRTSFWEGRFQEALSSLDRAIVLSSSVALGPDSPLSLVELQSYRLWNLWFLGHPRSARHLAERLEEEGKMSKDRKQGFFLAFAMALYRHLRLDDEVLRIADALAQLIEKMHFLRWAAPERGFRGWAEVRKGNAKGISLVLEGLALSRKFHRIAENNFLPTLAESWLLMGEPKKAAGVAFSGLRFSEKSGTHFYDAELWRLLGEARRLEGDSGAGEECFGRALSVARSQGARALELRALTSLLGLCLETGGTGGDRTEELSALIRLLDDPEADPELPDIREARRVCEALSSTRGGIRPRG